MPASKDLKITDVFAAKPRTLSFEFFPPKSEKGRANLFRAAEALQALSPDFMSVTYGAGGTDSHATLDIVKELQQEHGIPVMHHFTCTQHSRKEIREELNDLMLSGIHNILALRGDAPADEPAWQPGPDEPRYAFELIQLVRERADWFSIGVAVFPEGHPDTSTLELDAMYTRVKQEAGADFGITQLFFDAAQYGHFLTRMATEGVMMRLIPGVLPITNYPRLLQFCELCGATVPDLVRETFEPIADDLEATREKGIEFVTTLCRDLLALGAPGLHFYALNREEPTATILNALGDDWR